MLQMSNGLVMSEGPTSNVTRADRLAGGGTLDSWPDHHLSILQEHTKMVLVVHSHVGVVAGDHKWILQVTPAKNELVRRDEGTWRREET